MYRGLHYSGSKKEHTSIISYILNLISCSNHDGLSLGVIKAIHGFNVAQHVHSREQDEQQEQCH